MWLHSSVARASHRYRGGHGFESRWSPDFFRLLLSNCLNWKIYCDDHSSLRFPVQSMHDVDILIGYVNWIFWPNLMIISGKFSPLRSGILCKPKSNFLLYCSGSSWSKPTLSQIVKPRSAKHYLFQQDLFFFLTFATCSSLNCIDSCKRSISFLGSWLLIRVFMTFACILINIFQIFISLLLGFSREASSGAWLSY